MIVALVALVAIARQAPVVHGSVIDGASHAPVAAAAITGRGGEAISDAGGHFAIAARAGDTLTVRRIGYRPASIVVGAASVLVELRAAEELERVVVVGDSVAAPTAGFRSTDELRATGVVTLGDALARIPFVSARSSRGGIALSMRASRPEQVLVLLDGVPLNDPATGSADVSDIPLAALGAVAALPGAAAARYGSGASGGVLSLTSNAAPTLSLDAGSLGRVDASAAGSRTIGAAVVRAGGEWGRTRNDFEFINTVASRDTVERRANADEHHIALFATLTSPSVAATLLATRIERGLGGAMNVRIYDQARGTTERGLASVAASAGSTVIKASARLLDAAYDDPRAQLASRTTSVSADLEAARDVSGIRLRAGAGVDHVRGTTLHTESRPRAFVAAERGWRRDEWSASLAARADVIRDAGANVSPSLIVERRDRVTFFARVAQAFRAPSFYDLYFASPQWVDPTRTLRPERVDFDGEVGARATAGLATWSASLFARRTRDAIVWFPGTFSWSPNNAEREVVRGAEARLSVAASIVDVDIWGGVRSTNLSVDGLDAPTPYVPYADGGAIVTKRVGTLALSLSATVIGRRPFASVPNPTRAVELPATALADVALTWDAPRRGIVATIAVHDVGDTRWQSIVNYPTPGRSLSASLTIHP